MKELYELVLRNLSNCEMTQDRNRNKVCVIVDPRYNETMKSVINNFALIMTDWNFHIWSSKIYIEQIKKDFPNAHVETIEKWFDCVFMKDGIPNISIDDYSKILMATQFWLNIDEEHVLIFQSDCFCFNKPDDKYLEYDYCGANYYNQKHIIQNPSSSMYSGGIQGGCSLRKKSMMVRIINRIDFDLINGYRNVSKYRDNGITKSRLDRSETDLNTLNEDVFFTWACYILQLYVPDVDQRSEFSVEVDIVNKTCFYHGFNKNYHSEKRAERLFENSDIIKFLLI